MAAGLMITKGSFTDLPAAVKRATGGATGAAGDLVILRAGVLDVVTAGEAVFGVALEAFTNSASSKPLVNVTPGLQVVMDNDNVGTTFATTSVGKYYDITGGTGAMLVDTSTEDTTYTGAGTQKVLLAIEYNPQNVGLDDDVSVGLFIIKKRQY